MSTKTGPTCSCATHTDGSTTNLLCPVHADTDPCATTSRVTGKRRKGTVRRGTCTACGWSEAARRDRGIHNETVWQDSDDVWHASVPADHTTPSREAHAARAAFRAAWQRRGWQHQSDPSPLTVKRERATGHGTVIFAAVR